MINWRPARSWTASPRSYFLLGHTVMTIARNEGDGVVPARSIGTPRACRQASRAVLLLAMAALSSFGPARVALAGEPGTSGPAVGERVQALIPELEAYVATGMKAFDVPGVALGIIAGDELVYAKGFGVRSKAGGIPVDTRTIFQIGSTTKAFLATAIAMMVDRGKLRWDDRVLDLEPDFQLKDTWVTREFRVFDLLAQRSGHPPYANDMLGMRFPRKIDRPAGLAMVSCCRASA